MQADEKAQHTCEYVSILKRLATQLSELRWGFEMASEYFLISYFFQIWTGGFLPKETFCRSLDTARLPVASDSYNSNGFKSFHRQKGLMHPLFGDLNRKDAVVIGQGEANEFDVVEKNPFYIHLSVTGRCYARCQGCVNSHVTALFKGDRKDFVPIVDTRPERDAACILNLAKENGLSAIMDVYMQWFGRRRILPITHVNELIVYLLAGKKRNASACGVEQAMNYDLIDGKIHSCADLPAELAIGRIEEDGTPVVNPDNLAFLVDYKKDLGCYDCGVHNYCGGRCPVQAFTSGYLRMVQYCQLMRLHVGIVKTYRDDIVAYLKKNDMDLQDIYDQSAFFAQFTDVTP